ncbi:hypothetical protein BU25DRAFT_460581 [Macroventuria anomochaeta]|uniref:Uncharacterized protein n=1 Tax=Macroventuria anomochaeta TaxID=301207 RepID=A0ACB6RVG5_9PLEO|nr:uncharacterized protein BU25DRAFT_460581 [Macroventuria anomochaeta]KAF2625103.1 hypothetical protein BU25DRAFT_460581 [Macroventuria anomochaeta]
MTSCSLVANGLVSQVSGAVPTFSYHRTAHFGDYFGIQMTYLNGQSTCYQTGATPNFTPVIQNVAASYSVHCQFSIQGPTYTGIFCPNAPVTNIPNGVLTVSYINWYQNEPTPIPFLATFGPSPAPSTVTATVGAVATATATSTSTVSPGIASTATVYAAGATQTYTNTIIVTHTQTTTNTNYVSSCAAPPAASSSSRSSFSSAAQISSSTASALPTLSGFFRSCPADDGKAYVVGGKIFQIVCSYDRDGTTQTVIQLGNSLTGCITINELGCPDSIGFVDSYIIGSCIFVARSVSIQPRCKLFIDPRTESII